MLNVKMLAGAALVAILSTAGPARAAIVNYGIGATDGIGQTYNQTCDATWSCVDSLVTVSGLTFSSIISLDTAAGMFQYGDPQGGAGYSYLIGGAAFGAPSGGSFSFSSSAPQAETIGPTSMETRSAFYAQTNNMQFTLENQLTNSSTDMLTGDTIQITFAVYLSTSMYGGGGGIMNVGGEWVPNPSTTQNGQFYLSIAETIFRSDSNGQAVSYSYSSRDWSSNAARFFGLSTPVPEPGMVGLLGLGLLAIAGRRRKRVA